MLADGDGSPVTLSDTVFMKKFVTKIALHSQFLRFSSLLLTLVCILAGATSRADVFSYVDEEGAVCFTDSPRNKGSVRIYREKKHLGHGTVQRNSSVNQGRESDLGLADSYGSDKALPPDMTLPVDGRISSTVGLRHDPIDGQLRFHNGVDIAVAEGTPVRSVASGTVYFSGIRNGYGNMVIISHDDGMITIYAHNSINLMKEGEKVEKDTTIALSGSTGRSTGPHLHFEAWKNGINLTDSFLRDIPENRTALAVVHPRRESIRTSIRADGSILFTNLP